jgi:hypothetical protein
MCHCCHSCFVHHIEEISLQSVDCHENPSCCAILLSWTVFWPCSSSSLVVDSIAVAGSTSSIASSSSSSVVSISYQDLARAFGGPTYYTKDNSDKDETRDAATSSSSCPDHLLTAIAEAFGPDGLGFLEITHVPLEMVTLRQTVLTLAPQLPRCHLTN